ncbi:MAG: hypothetical protein AAF658_04660 [Myxococcota bacterium]
MECRKFGTVLSVKAASNQPGAVAVTFDDVKQAEHCACAMTGRWFDNVQIVVERIGDWDSPVPDDPLPPFVLPPDIAPPGSVVAVVRNAYTDNELANAPSSFLPDLEAEMQTECLKYGDLFHVATLPNHPALFGAVIVAFKSDQAFDNCQRDMDARWFDYRRLKVVRYQPATSIPENPPSPDDEEEVPRINVIEDEDHNSIRAPSLDDFFREIQQTSLL